MFFFVLKLIKRNFPKFFIFFPNIPHKAGKIIPLSIKKHRVRSARIQKRPHNTRNLTHFPHISVKLLLREICKSESNPGPLRRAKRRISHVRVFRPTRLFYSPFYFPFIFTYTSCIYSDRLALSSRFVFKLSCNMRRT